MIEQEYIYLNDKLKTFISHELLHNEIFYGTMHNVCLKLIKKAWEVRMDIFKELIAL